MGTHAGRSRYYSEIKKKQRFLKKKNHFKTISYMKRNNREKA